MDSEIVCIGGKGVRGEGSGEGQKRQTLLDSSTTEGCTALPFTHHAPQNIDN